MCKKIPVFQTALNCIHLQMVFTDLKLILSQKINLKGDWLKAWWHNQGKQQYWLVPSGRYILHFHPSQPVGHLTERHSRVVDCWLSEFPYCLRILAFLWSLPFPEQLYRHSMAEISPTKTIKTLRSNTRKSITQDSCMQSFEVFLFSKIHCISLKWFSFMFTKRVRPTVAKGQLLHGFVIPKHNREMSDPLAYLHSISVVFSWDVALEHLKHVFHTP